MRSCCASLGIILGKNTAENEGWKVPYETLSVVATKQSIFYSVFVLRIGLDATACIDRQ